MTGYYIGAALAANDASPEQLTGAIYTLAVTIIVTILGYVGNVLVKRVRGRASEPDMWARIDDLTKTIYGDVKEEDPGLLRRVAVAESRADAADRKAAATGRLVRELARQWPGDLSPRLNPDDLAELDHEFIPPDHPWRIPPSRSIETKGG